MSDKPYRFPEIDITKLRRQFDPCDDAQRIKPPLTRDTYPTCRAFSVAMGSVVLPHIDDSVQFDPKTRCPIGYRRITNVAMDLVDVEDQTANLIYVGYSLEDILESKALDTAGKEIPNMRGIYVRITAVKKVK